MPHINVKLYPGRDEQLKAELAQKIFDTALEALGCSASALSVSIEEVKPEEWNGKVKDVIPKENIYVGEMWEVK